MQAHTTEGLHLHRQKAGRLAIPALVRTGAIAGLAGGMVMAMWQMIFGAVAQQPTAVPGIDTSFWTAITAIPSVPFGLDWFQGSFELGAVAVGLMGHMMNSMMLGAVGVGLLAMVLGSRPSIAKGKRVRDDVRPAARGRRRQPDRQPDPDRRHPLSS